MENRPSVFDDVKIRGLEATYRGSVVKIFLRNHGNMGWTGFLVSSNPCVIMTVAHPIKSFTKDQILSDDTFYVKFYNNPFRYKASGLKYSLRSDLLLLRCDPPPEANPFIFANHTDPLPSSTSLFCISHPAQRDWRTLRGTTCCVPFEIGTNPDFAPDMLIFDHDAQLVAGSSGAPIIDLTGQVIGMQFTEYIVREHGFCVGDKARLPSVDAYRNVNQLARQIKEFPFCPCNLKQAITVQYLATTLQEFFQEEGVNLNTDLNSYLSESVVIFSEREQERRKTQPDQGKQPPSGPPPPKKLREKSLLQCRRRPNMEHPTRIAPEAAKGLASLHEDCNPKILFRHVKAASILLGFKSDSKVVSFDLDKSVPRCCRHEAKVTTNRVSHEFYQKESSPMDQALEIQEHLASIFPTFVKNMLLSHVTARFCLDLPKNFSGMHLPKHDEKVLLVDKTELEQETHYLAQKNSPSVGWRGFSIAHKLQEKDVSVFNLIQQCKYKVYTVRANALTEIERATDLLNLGACIGEMSGDRREKDTVLPREGHLEQYSAFYSVQEKDMVALRKNVDAADNHSGINFGNWGSYDSEGIKVSQSVSDFKDVKRFENFNITVNRFIVHFEIPHHFRVKYLELRCSQKSYLRDQLIDVLNLQLGGVISETINIADSIKSSTCENLKIWDDTSKALGMEVGFVRARMNTLMKPSSDSEDDLKGEGTMVKAKGIVMQ